MPNTNLQFQPAEFQAVPLDFIIATPLVSTVNAMAAAAKATSDMIKELKGETVELELKHQVGSEPHDTKVIAPLLSMVPLPHLRIDSLTVHFRYEITQTVTSKAALSGGGSLDIGLPGFLKMVGNFNLKGNVTRSTEQENVTNRSGLLEITIHASEAEVPKGLEKLLNLLADGIQVTTK
jgi:hypothetical protein